MRKSVGDVDYHRKDIKHKNGGAKMGIIPGTTPTLVLTLDESIAGCTAAERR